MKANGKYKQSLGLTTVAILLFGVFPPALAAPQENSGPPSQKKTDQYVGVDVCKTCHEDLYKKNFENTAHFKTTLNDGHGCESCHGPGSAHVEGGGDVSKIVSFKSMSKQDANALCLTCHGAKHEQRHFAASAHASNDVGCLDCHSPHNAKEPEHLLVRAQPSLCYGCHATAKADFAKPYHHRVDEGLIQCSDCHNVHGTATLRQVRAMPSGDAICVKCHADKQGPFVYEHVPVKTEGCSSCQHAPRIDQSTLLAGEPGEPAVPAVSHISRSGTRGTFPQSVHQISSVHDVPRSHPWVQCEQRIF